MSKIYFTFLIRSPTISDSAHFSSIQLENRLTCASNVSGLDFSRNTQAISKQKVVKNIGV